MPVSAESLSRVRAELRPSNTAGSRQKVITEIKKDFALFAYCVRELARKTLKNKKQSAPDPKTLLENASDDDLRTILLKEPGSFSSHRLEEISEPQANQFKQAMISATVAETLSEITNVEPINAYATAILRQLGLTLIAWNYPHVFKRVLAATEPGMNLDEGLSRFLGFSPTMLGVRIAREWGISPLIRAGMGDSKAKEEILADGGEDAQKLAGIERVCRIGETLAKVSDPSLADHTTDFTSAKGEIEQMLGRDAFRILREKISQSCSAYASYAPQTFKSASPVASTAIKLTKASEALFRNNIYIKHCEPEIREELKELYLRMDGRSIIKDNVDFLVKHIIPVSGFARGAIFLVEPESSKLVPRLAIGSASINEFRSVNYASTGSTYEPVASAFRCSTPIMEENVNLGSGNVSYIVGAMGDIQKSGVLYLEFDANNPTKNPLLVFKALRTALSDCLGIH